MSTVPRATEQSAAADAALETSHQSFQALRVTREQDDSESLQSCLSRLLELHPAWLEQEHDKQLHEKVVGIGSTEELSTRLGTHSGVADRVGALEERCRQLMDVRRQRTEQVGRAAEELDQARKGLREDERLRPDVDREIERVAKEWELLEKRNSKRRSALQAESGDRTSTLEECQRLLDKETRLIQSTQDEQRQLENDKVDAIAQVNQHSARSEELEKKRDHASRAPDAKKWEQESLTLQHMEHWYTEVNRLLSSTCECAISSVTDEYVEVCVNGSHSLRLFFDRDSVQLQAIEALQKSVRVDDLVSAALQDNDVLHLVTSYRARVFDSLATHSSA